MAGRHCPGTIASCTKNNQSHQYNVSGTQNPGIDILLCVRVRVCVLVLVWGYLGAEAAAEGEGDGVLRGEDHDHAAEQAHGRHQDHGLRRAARTHLSRTIAQQSANERKLF